MPLLGPTLEIKLWHFFYTIEYPYPPTNSAFGDPAPLQDSVEN
jgi:hypothetical protein